MDWLIKAALNEIEHQMARLYWNKYQKEMESSPFQNTGAEYSNDTFTVRAYNWNDEDDVLPNFEYKDLKIYWYKHSQRGLQWYYNCSKNTLPSSAFLEDMLEDCVESLERDFDTRPGHYKREAEKNDN